MKMIDIDLGEPRSRLVCRHFIMPVRRRSYSSRRRYGPRRSPRYVNDAIATRIPVTQATARYKVIAGATINGIRRVARLDMTIGTPTTTGQFAFVLIYVPEGIDPDRQDMNLSAVDAQTSIYTPEQHVIASGTVTFGGVQRYFVPSGRALASNDSIYLFARAFEESSVGVLDVRISFMIAFA
jgi:hypothetical protein